MSLKLQSFGPIADKHSRVLVLGTMPGAMSLAKRQYYGHPRNAFWPIMARLCDRELPEDYALRKAMLLDAGIALWDVLRRVRAGRKPRQQHLPREAEPHRRTAAQLSLDPRDRFQRTGRRTTVQETLRPARLGIRSADPAFDQPRPCRRVRQETGRDRCGCATCPCPADEASRP